MTEAVEAEPVTLSLSSSEFRILIAVIIVGGLCTCVLTVVAIRYIVLAFCWTPRNDGDKKRKKGHVASAVDVFWKASPYPMSSPGYERTAKDNPLASVLPSYHPGSKEGSELGGVTVAAPGKYKLSKSLRMKIASPPPLKPDGTEDAAAATSRVVSFEATNVRLTSDFLEWELGDETGAGEKPRLDLTEIVAVTALNDPTSWHLFLSDNSTVEFQASTPEERKLWIDAICARLAANEEEEEMLGAVEP